MLQRWREEVRRICCPFSSRMYLKMARCPAGHWYSSSRAMQMESLLSKRPMAWALDVIGLGTKALIGVDLESPLAHRLPDGQRHLAEFALGRDRRWWPRAQR